jgi:predicted GNAT family acetyltransferase
VIGWSERDLLEEAIVAPRNGFVPLPDTRLIVRPGWHQLITPSLPEGGLNEVAWSVLAEDEADAVIDATVAEYQRAGAHFRWALPAGSAPADLAERLERRGFSRAELVVMVASTRGAAPPAGIDLEIVGAAEVDAFTQVMAEGWQMSPAPLDRFHRAVLADPQRRVRMVLARDGGVPAGAAAYNRFARSIYLQGAVVLPGHRGKGLYRAMVAARLAEAAAAGLELATIQANAKTSAPILARLGFRELCRFPLLRSPPPAEAPPIGRSS